jgi:hypothetical protein
MHLTQRGFRVRLVTADGTASGPAWHEHGALDTEAGALLESLAVLTDSVRVDMDGSWLTDTHATGLLVAVVGQVMAADRAVLARMRHAASVPLAIALDVDRWSGGSAGPEPTPAVRLLGAHGWRAVSAGPTDPLPTVWKQLALTGGRHRGGPVAAGSRGPA